ADVHKYYVEEALQHIIGTLERRLTALIDAGVMRPVDPALTARMMSATTMGFAALFELGVSIGTDSPEKLGAFVTDIQLNGLRNGLGGGEK
ncbi:MAG: hypothetical protein KC449_30435, partial [Anaerolineales bacterium]|nr:hypothetical protein [Anaerolineales bacterium]